MNEISEIKVEVKQEYDLEVENKEESEKNQEEEIAFQRNYNIKNEVYESESEFIGIKEEPPNLVYFKITEIENENTESGGNLTETLDETSLPLESERSKTSPCIKCIYCDRVFGHQRNVSFHIKYSHRGFPSNYITGSSIQCQICQEVYDGVDDLSKHIKDNHPEIENKPKYECALCGKMWKAMHILKRHMKVHQTERSFSCHICLRSYLTKTNLNRHIDFVHSGKRPFQCPEPGCLKSYKTKYDLKEHSVLHGDDLPFKCKDCDNAFQTKQRLRGHRIKHHGERQPIYSNNIYQCVFCPKSFSFESQLKFHMITHSDERQYKCNICPKAFKYKCLLMTHLKAHETKSKESKETIEVFPQYEDDPKKPYKCEICHKGFKDRSKMKLHSEGHRTEENFKCEHCPKAFKGEERLLHHLKYTHSGNCTCTICGRVLSGRYALLKHIRHQHKPTTSWTCPVCSNTYTAKKTLLRHMMSIHKISQDVATKNVNGIVRKSETVNIVPVQAQTYANGESLETVIVKSEYEVNYIATNYSHS